MAETEIRTVRVPDELWDRALARARTDNTTLSRLIRGWLADYASADDNVITLCDAIARLEILAKRLKN
jgi:hypothetical protein